MVDKHWGEIATWLSMIYWMNINIYMNINYTFNMCFYLISEVRSFCNALYDVVEGAGGEWMYTQKFPHLWFWAVSKAVTQCCVNLLQPFGAQSVWKNIWTWFSQHFRPRKSNWMARSQCFGVAYITQLTIPMKRSAYSDPISTGQSVQYWKRMPGWPRTGICLPPSATISCDQKI